MAHFLLAKRQIHETFGCDPMCFHIIHEVRVLALNYIDKDLNTLITDDLTPHLAP